MAIKIFSTSHLSGLPSQAVSLIRFNIFKRLGLGFCEYWTTADGFAEDSGSIKIIKTSFNSRLVRYLVRFYWMWKLKPDVIMFAGEPLELPFLIFKPKKSIAILHQNGPMLYPIFSYPHRTLRYDLLWHSINFFLKRVKIIITISKYTANTLRIFQPKASIDIIYNGVDLQNFHPGLSDFALLKQRFRLNRDKPLVINISSLIERKRLDLYVNIAKACPECEFVLIGSPQDGFGRKLLQKFSAIKNLTWFPEISRKDLPLLLASSDLFVFPSLFEGFGMVVAEAMASGCPVVLSAGSGPEELVADGGGVIIPRSQDEQREISDFVLAIRDLLSNPVKLEEMSRIARDQALKKFDWNNLAIVWQQSLGKRIQN